MTQPPDRVDVSVVIPVYNEEENLRELAERLFGAIGPLAVSFELIFVDDGSRDGGAALLRRMQADHPEIRLIQFDANYGQTAAIDAGFRAARGRAIAMIDADLQNDPADLPRLLAQLNTYDCATGQRVKRNDPWLRKLSTRIANGVRNRVSGERISDSACGLKAFRREVVERLKLYNGMHRFLPTLARIEGFRVVEVPVAHHPRTRGKAKYNIRNRVFRALVDLFAVTWMKKRRLRYRIKEER